MRKKAAAAGITVTVAAEPPTPIVWAPAVARVTENVCVPLSAGVKV